MFNADFYPTPQRVIDQLIEGLEVRGKKFLEPEGGSGTIVTRLYDEGAESVISCEIDPDLKKILQTKCVVIADDFLTVTSDQVSHIDAIVMNPPFSKGAEHILHAWNIAPSGCVIRALCNLQTIKNPYSKSREELKTVIETYGSFQDIGDAFAEADRETGVQVALIRIEKPGESYAQEFAGFFMDDDPEEEQVNGLMSYNAVRDLVNRYVESIKIYDQQLDTAARLNEMQSGYFDAGELPLTVAITRGNIPLQRNEFKKGMQKQGWHWIFGKLNMKKYATKGLKEDINKFVETQENVPFTMRNIYKMLEIVVSTTGSRMDKAILEVFDKVTAHHADNRYNIEGWKTNSHYLLTKRFITPRVVEMGWSGEVTGNSHSGNFEMIEDLLKALCYITGDNYDDHISLHDFLNYPYLLVKDGKYLKDKQYDDHIVHYKSRSADGYNSLESDKEKIPGSEIQFNKLEWGKWFEWSYFKIRAYKKGTVHFEFKDEKVWAMFNHRVAKLKGYPLPEKREQTKYQARQNGQKPVEPMVGRTDKIKRKPVVLTTINIG